MKTVILTPNPYRDKNFQTVRKAQDILREEGINTRICLPFEVDKSFELPRDLRFFRLDRELPNAEMVICFGGDGTILHIAKMSARKEIPILGVNIGTMGFMAELENTELEKLRQLARGEFSLENRMMLDVTVHRQREIVFHDICLNDATVTKGAVARVVHLNVRCDGTQVMECAGDGVIVATPTGSTAYSLSAGGPIVEPEARNMLITPVCVHDITNRCIVTSDKRTITIGLARNAKRNAYLSIDGGKAFRLSIGDVVTIQKSRLDTKLLRLKDRSFFDVVNSKFRKL